MTINQRNVLEMMCKRFQDAEATQAYNIYSSEEDRFAIIRLIWYAAIAVIAALINFFFLEKTFRLENLGYYLGIPLIIFYILKYFRWLTENAGSFVGTSIGLISIPLFIWAIHFFCNRLLGVKGFIFFKLWFKEYFLLLFVGLFVGINLLIIIVTKLRKAKAKEILIEKFGDIDKIK